MYRLVERILERDGAERSCEGGRRRKAAAAAALLGGDCDAVLYLPASALSGGLLTVLIPWIGLANRMQARLARKQLGIFSLHKIEKNKHQHPLRPHSLFKNQEKQAGVDLVFTAMVGRCSPRFNMVGRGSPRLSSAKRNRRGSPSEKSRASWNQELVKSLVELLHEHNNAAYRGIHGWSSQAWNKIVKEFHDRNKYVSFTKAQIQDKEGELKRDYKILKGARRQSGCRWNEQRCMIEAEPDVWDNIIATFPKARKFLNNKASFPQFDSLGELYDGNLAEGTCSFTSIRSPQDPSLRQMDDRNELDDSEFIIPDSGEVLAYDVEDADAQEQRNEDEDASVARNGKQRRADTESRDQEDEDASFARNAQQRRAATVSTSAKKLGGSPGEKSRASWNRELEKSLVELLHEHNNAAYRGVYGWSSQAWNKIVKEFHDRNEYVSFTKTQIQEKENQLKRDYKILKGARRQSGCRWNEQRCMIEAEPDVWDNIIATFPKARKFRNHKASFPLFDSLGQLYDGHLAEGTCSFTSIRSPQDPSFRQIDSRNEPGNTEFIIPESPDSGEALAYDVEDADAQEQRNETEDEDASVARNGKQRSAATASRDQEDEDASFARIGQRRRAATASTSAEKFGGSSSEKSRASWNPELEKSLVELLHEHNNTHYRGVYGWSSHAWNRIVKEFHDRNKYVSFSKAQIQEKENQLKKDYKMLKEARRQSGCRWNEQKCMVEAGPDVWDNIFVTFPKARKFRYNKFPLFDSLGQLYDGHLAVGTYSFTSIRSPQDLSLKQIDNRNELGTTEFIISDLGFDVEDLDAQDQRNEDEDASVARNGKQRRAASASRDQEYVDAQERRNGDEDASDARNGMQIAASASRDQEDEDASLARNGQQRRATTASRDQEYEDARNGQQRRATTASRDQEYEDARNGQQKRVAVVSTNMEEREPKRPKKSTNIEEMMERYLDTRTKQAEDVLLAKIKEVVQGMDISIKRCISVLNSMEVTKEEKAKAYSVFKSQVNREIFLSACDEDTESALIWLRNEMA
ncbi:hypothetical protein EJB05_06221, partial [Eragrostis curvula]